MICVSNMQNGNSVCIMYVLTLIRLSNVCGDIIQFMLCMCWYYLMYMCQYNLVFVMYVSTFRVLVVYVVTPYTLKSVWC